MSEADDRAPTGAAPPHDAAPHDAAPPTPPAPAAPETAPPAPPAAPVPRAMSAGRLALLLGGLLVVLYLGSVVVPPVRAGLSRVVAALFPRHGAAGEHGATRYYTCGMHPWVVLPRPGDCPICGMKLVPLDPAKFSGEVTIDPVVAQNIGVRVARVETGAGERAIRTVGTVAYDEALLGDVNLKVAGWIEKLHVDSQGAPVRKGQALLELYSPELYAAQEEYLLAVRAGKQAGGDGPAADLARQLLAPARTKLAYFDIGKAQIAALEARGTPAKTMTIRSPQSGVVIEKHVVEGMKVVPGMTAYRIADLSRVWVMATLYEYQSQDVKVGTKATMTLTYLPGESLTGTVVYVYPYLDQRTRQVTVRLEFPNPKRVLKPGMFATVVFDTASTKQRLLVPRAAVIDTGERQVVFVSRGAGRFEPRPVRMGADAGDGKVEILEGLTAGELVVTSGQFLLDSEARMREALARMVRGTPVAEAAAPPAPTSQPAVTLPPAAATALGNALDAYLAAGAALAGDTTRDLGVSARTIAEAVAAMEAVPIPERPHFWHEHPGAAAVEAQARALAAAGSLGAARQAFAPLSAALAALLATTGVPPKYARALEEQHCPMYPEGSSGSVWIQAAGPVRNPYFGSAMLTCSDRRRPLPKAP